MKPEIQLQDLPKIFIDKIIDFYFILKLYNRNPKFHKINNDRIFNYDLTFKSNKYKNEYDYYQFEFEIEFEEYIGDYMKVRPSISTGEVDYAQSMINISPTLINRYCKEASYLKIEKINWNEIENLKKQFYNEHRGSLSAKNLGLL